MHDPEHLDTQVKQQKLLDALEQGDVTRVQALIAAGINPLRYQYYGDPAKPSLGGMPLVYHAIEKGHSLAMLQLLVAQKANPHTFYRDDSHTVSTYYENNRCYHRRTDMSPLFVAARSGNLEAVHFLLGFLAVQERSAVIDFLSTDGSRRGTPLLGALKNGHEAVAELLLAEKADVNGEDQDGKTALMQAANIGNKNAVGLLLEAKAKIGVRDYDRKSATDHALHGNLETLQTLLSAKGNINLDQEALDIAAGGKDIRIVEKLLREGVGSVNGKSKYGWTPAQSAGQAGKADILLLLMRSKANPGLKGLDPSPLYKAGRRFSKASDGDRLKISFIQLLFNWRSSSKWHKAESREGIKQLRDELTGAADAGNSENLDAKLAEASEMLGSDVSGLKLYFGVKFKQQPWVDELSQDKVAVSLSALYAKGMGHLNTHTALLKLQKPQKPRKDPRVLSGGGGGGSKSDELGGPVSTELRDEVHGL